MIAIIQPAYMKLLYAGGLLSTVRAKRVLWNDRPKHKSEPRFGAFQSRLARTLDLMLEELSEVNDMKTNRESQIPAMPINLPCRLEAGAGPELERFIHERWLITAALLRLALQNHSAAQSTGPRR